MTTSSEVDRRSGYMKNNQVETGLAIDLEAAATALKAEYGIVARLIQQTSDAHSIYTDLATAHDMVCTLPSIIQAAKREAASPNWASNCALALLNTAIMLYVRATKTSSRHRRSFDMRSKLDAEQKIVHDKLCALRDDAIAHFGPGHLRDNLTWQIEGIFIPLDRPDDLKIMTGSRRIFQQQELQDEFKLQLERALDIAKAEVNRRNSRLVDSLNSHIGDKRLLAILHEHRVNLRDFFEGDTARDEALGGLRQGIVSGHTEHR